MRNPLAALCVLLLTVCISEKKQPDAATSEPASVGKQAGVASREEKFIEKTVGLEKRLPLAFSTGKDRSVAFVSACGGSANRRLNGSPEEYCRGSYAQITIGSPVLSSCSGLAVSPSAVLTAFHCITTMGGAENLCVVSGYHEDAFDYENYPELGKAKTCAQLEQCCGNDCPEVRSARVAIAGTGETKSVNDWVILELDKPLNAVAGNTDFGVPVETSNVARKPVLYSYPGGVPLMEGPVEVCSLPTKMGLLYSLSSVVSGSSGGAIFQGQTCIGMHVGRTPSTYNGLASLCAEHPDDEACDSSCDSADCGKKIAIAGTVLKLAVEEYGRRSPLDKVPAYFRYNGKRLVRTKPACTLTRSEANCCLEDPECG